MSHKTQVTTVNTQDTTADMLQVLQMGLQMELQNGALQNKVMLLVGPGPGGCAAYPA